MVRPFTGLHLAAILVTFFTVVVAVNMTMAVMASRTFGGTVVDNSYVASQRYNDWLAEARRQEERGIDARVTLDEQRHLTLSVKADLARPTAVPVGHAEHLLGREDDIVLRFAMVGPGKYRSIGSIPVGRWIVRASVQTVNGEVRVLEHVE